MLAFPFKIHPSGRAAQVEDDSDEADAQQIAMLMLTRREERPLVPEYGMQDPTYDTTGRSPGDIAASIAAFGPDVQVDDVTERTRGDGTSDISVTFNR